MKNKSLILIALAAALTVGLAASSHAYVLFSENFEGGTTGQSILDAPFNWLKSPGYDSGISISENEHGWTSKFLGGTACDAGPVWQGAYKSMTMPIEGQTVLEWDMWMRPGAAAIGALSGGAGFCTASGGARSSWRAEGFGYLAFRPNEASWGTKQQIFVDVNAYPVVHCKIIWDVDAGKVWGELTYGETTQTTQEWTAPTDTSGIEAETTVYAWDSGYVVDGSRNHVNHDNMVVSATGILAGTLTGAVALDDYSGESILSPIRVEVKQAETVVQSAWIYTGESFTFPSLTPGDYQVAISSSKCPRKVYDVAVEPAGTVDLGTITLLNGDLNGDNSVGFADFNILRKNWGVEGD